MENSNKRKKNNLFREWYATISIVFGISAVVQDLVRSSILTPWLGGGLIVLGTAMFIGIIMIIRNAVLCKHPKQLKQAEIEASDERSRFILDKTCKIGWGIQTSLLLIAIIIAGFFYDTVYEILFPVFFSSILIFWIAYFIVSKKY